MFNEIDHKEKVYLKVLKQFKDLLCTNDLKPGDKLPPEREMAKLLGVSRPALKQALCILEAQDIIECRQGDGNYILPIGRNLFNPITMDFYLQHGNTDNILEFRCVIEIYVTKMAALRGLAKEDLSPLYDVVSKMSNDQPLEERIELNNKFHYELIRLSKNPLIIAIYSSIIELIGKQIHTTDGKNFKDEHASIIEAIQSGDPALAAKTMVNHFKKKFPGSSYYSQI